MKHNNQMFTKLILALAVTILACTCMSNTRTEAAGYMTRYDFLRATLREMGMYEAPTGKNATEKIEAAMQSYGLYMPASAYLVVNSGVTSADMKEASTYGLSNDNTTVIAAALKLGLFEKSEIPSRMDLSSMVTYYWAGHILTNADHLLYGTTKEVTEKYMSDEIDYYILYDLRHDVKEYIYDPTFTWEEDGRKYLSSYAGFTLVPQYNGKTATSKSTIKFAFIDTFYKEKERTLTVGKHTDADRELVMDRRITDIDLLKTDRQRRDFAEAYLLGFIRGTKDGDYIDTRHCYPTTYVQGDEALRMLASLTDKELRYKLSPDFKMLRLDKASYPESYMLYPYIVDSFPNSYYDTGYEGIKCWYDVDATLALIGDYEKRAANTLVRAETGEDLIFPFEMEKFLADDSGNSIGTDKKNLTTRFVDETMEYYRHLLNVDYRTVDDDAEWKAYMAEHLTDFRCLTILARTRREKTVVRCDLVAADMSGVYYANGCYHCKVYVHFIQEGDAPMALYCDETGDAYSWLPQTYPNFWLNRPFEGAGVDYIHDVEYLYDDYIARDMNGNPGTDVPNVWNDHFCVSSGVPFEPDGEVRYVAGMIRSSIAGDENGMAAVRKYMKAFGY